MYINRTWQWKTATNRIRRHLKKKKKIHYTDDHVTVPESKDELQILEHLTKYRCK